jgi:hypothetical protein
VSLWALEKFSLHSLKNSNPFYLLDASFYPLSNVEWFPSFTHMNPKKLKEVEVVEIN